MTWLVLDKNLKVKSEVKFSLFMLLDILAKNSKRVKRIDYKSRIVEIF